MLLGQNAGLDKPKRQKMSVGGCQGDGSRVKLLAGLSWQRASPGPAAGPGHVAGGNQQACVRLVTGHWVTNQTFFWQSQAIPLCYSDEKAKATHIYLWPNQNTRCLMCLLLLVTVFHRICCWEAKVTDLRSYIETRVYIKLCVCEFGHCHSCHVLLVSLSVSLSFTVTFHLLLWLPPPILLSLCTADPASVNSTSPQSAVLYWHES